jgi:hypothetical protein
MRSRTELIFQVVRVNFMKANGSRGLAAGCAVLWQLFPVIASEAKQSSEKGLDCFVACAPRNDG